MVNNANQTELENRALFYRPGRGGGDKEGREGKGREGKRREGSGFDALPVVITVVPVDFLILRCLLHIIINHI